VYECNGSTGLWENRSKDGYNYNDLTSPGGIGPDDKTAKCINEQALAPTPDPQHPAKKSCSNNYGDVVSELPDGAVSIGPLQNGNNRWQCVDGLWKQCLGCMLTVIPDYLASDPAFKKEQEAYYKTVGDAATLYGKTYQDCIDAKKNTDADCKAVAQKVLDANKNLTQQQKDAATQSYVRNTTIQEQYYPLYEKYQLCLAQHNNDYASCAELSHQLTKLAGSQGLTVDQLTNEKTGINTQGFQAYLQNKLVSAYLTAQSDYEKCLAAKQTSCVDASTQVLNYPGLSDQMKKTIIAIGDLQKEYLKTNDELCVSIPDCNPDRRRAELMAAATDVPNEYKDMISKSYQRQIIITDVYTPAVNSYGDCITKKESGCDYYKSKALGACKQLEITDKDCQKTLDQQVYVTRDFGPAMTDYFACTDEQCKADKQKKILSACAAQMTGPQCSSMFAQSINNYDDQVNTWKNNPYALLTQADEAGLQNTCNTANGHKCSDTELQTFREHAYNSLSKADKDAYDANIQKQTLEMLKNSKGYADYLNSHPNATAVDYQKSQEDALARFKDKLKSIYGEGTKEYNDYLAKVQSGEINVEGAEKAYDATKKANLLNRLVVTFNELSGGATKRGNDVQMAAVAAFQAQNKGTVFDNVWVANAYLVGRTFDTIINPLSNIPTVLGIGPKLSVSDQLKFARGAVQQGALPAAGGVLAVGAIAALPFVGVITAPLTIASTMIIGGTALGIAGTTSGLSQVAQYCDGTKPNEKACIVSVINTGVMAVGTVIGVGAGESQLANVAARVAVSKAEQAAGTSAISELTQQAVQTGEKAALASTQTAGFFQSAQRMFSGATTLWFGYQAGESCFGDQANRNSAACATNVLMTLASASQLGTSFLKQAQPLTTVASKGAAGVNVAANGAQAFSACILSQGRDVAGCTQAVGGLAMSVHGLGGGAEAGGGKSATVELDKATSELDSFYEGGKLKAGVSFDDVTAAKTAYENAVTARSMELANISRAMETVSGKNLLAGQKMLLDKQASYTDALRAFEDFTKENGVKPAQIESPAVTQQRTRLQTALDGATQDLLQTKAYALHEEQLATKTPKNIVEQAGDTLARLTGREPAESQAFRLAQDEFKKIAVIAAPDSAEYQIAARKVEDAQREILIQKATPNDITIEKNRAKNSIIALDSEKAILEKQLASMTPEEAKAVRDAALRDLLNAKTNPNASEADLLEIQRNYNNAQAVYEYTQYSAAESAVQERYDSRISTKVSDAVSGIRDRIIGTKTATTMTQAGSTQPGIRQRIADSLTGRNVEEDAQTARRDYVSAEESLAGVNAEKTNLEKAGKTIPDELTQKITDLTKQVEQAKTGFDTAQSKADQSLAARFGRFLDGLAGKPSEAVKVRTVDTIGKLSVAADAIRNEGFKVVRDSSTGDLRLEDSTGTGKEPSPQATARLKEVSDYLKTIEKNFGKEMVGPNSQTGRADQSAIFYDTIFDSSIKEGIVGVLYNGSTGLGKSSFLLNAIADTKVALTGTKANVLATTWADVEGMMREYPPEVHAKNGVRAVYYDIQNSEVTYFDTVKNQKLIVSGAEAVKVMENAQVVYTATVETPYEFHTSRQNDPLTQAFMKATTGAIPLIDEFDVIAGGTRYSSSGLEKINVSQTSPELTTRYRQMYGSDAVEKFVNSAIGEKTTGVQSTLFEVNGQNTRLADTVPARTAYKDMVMEAARQSFEASKARGDTTTFEQFAQQNHITVDEQGSPRSSPQDIVNALDAYRQSSTASDAFKNELRDRVGAVNAIIDIASRSTNGYGFDAEGGLVYGDGTGRLQNTRPQEALSALSLDTVGYRIQEAVRGAAVDHATAGNRIDTVTVSDQGETTTWKEILSKGHYADRLYGFTGTPEGVAADAKMSLGMDLKTPEPDRTSYNQTFGDRAVRKFEWFKIAKPEQAVLNDLAKGEAARVVIDAKDVARQIPEQQMINEGKRMGPDVDVIILNNDNGVAEGEKVRIYRDGNFVESIEGDAEKSAIQKMTERYAYGERGDKRIILVYTQGSGRGTDISGVFAPHELSSDGQTLIKGSTDAEYLFASEKSTNTTDAVQDIGRAREIAEKGKVFILSNESKSISVQNGLDIFNVNEGMGGSQGTRQDFLTNSLRQGYDDLVKNTIDRLSQMSTQQSTVDRLLGRNRAELTTTYEGKQMTVSEAWKNNYDRIAGINDSLTQGMETGTESLDRAALRAREFINALKDTPEFAQLSPEAQEYYFDNIYNGGDRMTLTLSDVLPTGNTLTGKNLQEALTIDERTKIINANVTSKDIALEVVKQGRETPVETINNRQTTSQQAQNPPVPVSQQTVESPSVRLQQITAAQANLAAARQAAALVPQPLPTVDYTKLQGVRTDLERQFSIISNTPKDTTAALTPNELANARKLAAQSQNADDLTRRIIDSWNTRDNADYFAPGKSSEVGMAKALAAKVYTDAAQAQANVESAKQAVDATVKQETNRISNYFVVGNTTDDMTTTPFNDAFFGTITNANDQHTARTAYETAVNAVIAHEQAIVVAQTNNTSEAQATSVSSTKGAAVGAIGAFLNTLNELHTSLPQEQKLQPSTASDSILNIITASVLASAPATVPNKQTVTAGKAATSPTENIISRVQKFLSNVHLPEITRPSLPATVSSFGQIPLKVSSWFDGVRKSNPTVASLATRISGSIGPWFEKNVRPGLNLPSLTASRKGIVRSIFNSSPFNVGNPEQQQGGLRGVFWSVINTTTYLLSRSLAPPLVLYDAARAIRFGTLHPQMIAPAALRLGLGLLMSGVMVTFLGVSLGTGLQAIVGSIGLRIFSLQGLVNMVQAMVSPVNLVTFAICTLVFQFGVSAKPPATVQESTKPAESVEQVKTQPAATRAVPVAGYTVILTTDSEPKAGSPVVYYYQNQKFIGTIQSQTKSPDGKIVWFIWSKEHQVYMSPESIYKAGTIPPLPALDEKNIPVGELTPGTKVTTVIAGITLEGTIVRRYDANSYFVTITTEGKYKGETSSPVKVKYISGWTPRAEQRKKFIEIVALGAKYFDDIKTEGRSYDAIRADVAWSILELTNDMPDIYTSERVAFLPDVTNVVLAAKGITPESTAEEKALVTAETEKKLKASLLSSEALKLVTVALEQLTQGVTPDKASEVVAAAIAANPVVQPLAGEPVFTGVTSTVARWIVDQIVLSLQPNLGDSSPLILSVQDQVTTGTLVTDAQIQAKFVEMLSAMMVGERVQNVDPVIRVAWITAKAQELATHITKPPPAAVVQPVIPVNPNPPSVPVAPVVEQPAAETPEQIAARVNALDKTALAGELFTVAKIDGIDPGTALVTSSYVLVAGKAGYTITGPLDPNYVSIPMLAKNAIRDTAIAVEFKTGPLYQAYLDGNESAPVTTLLPSGAALMKLMEWNGDVDHPAYQVGGMLAQDITPYVQQLKPGISIAKQQEIFDGIEAVLKKYEPKAGRDEKLSISYVRSAIDDAGLVDPATGRRVISKTDLVDLLLPRENVPTWVRAIISAFIKAQPPLAAADDLFFMPENITELKGNLKGFINQVNMALGPYVKQPALFKETVVPAQFVVWTFPTNPAVWSTAFAEIQTAKTHLRDAQQAISEKRQDDAKNLIAQVDTEIPPTSNLRPAIAAQYESVQKVLDALEKQSSPQPVEQTLPSGLARPLNANELQTLNNAKTDARQGTIAKELLNDSKTFPTVAIEIDNQVYYFVSSVLQVPKSTRLYSVVYSIDPQGRILPRIVYRSKSGGEWMATPGFNPADRTIQKGMSYHYTQEGKLVLPLAAYLESQKSVVSLDHDIMMNQFTLGDLMAEGYFTYDKEITKYDDKGALSQFQKYPPGKYSKVRPQAGSFADALDTFDYSNLPGFVPDFSVAPTQTWKSTHLYLGEITLESYPAVFQGRPVRWVMAHDAAGRVWIDRIFFTDAKPSSYGNYSEVLDTGALTNKPFEYTSQIHNLQNSTTSTEYISSYNYGSYADITPLLDHLAPIAEYRVKRAIQRSSDAQVAAPVQTVPATQPAAPVVEQKVTPPTPQEVAQVVREEIQAESPVTPVERAADIAASAIPPVDLGLKAARSVHIAQAVEDDLAPPDNEQQIAAKIKGLSAKATTARETLKSQALASSEYQTLAKGAFGPSRVWLKQQLKGLKPKLKLSDADYTSLLANRIINGIDAKLRSQIPVLQTTTQLSSPQLTTVTQPAQQTGEAVNQQLLNAQAQAEDGLGRVKRAIDSAYAEVRIVSNQPIPEFQQLSTQFQYITGFSKLTHADRLQHIYMLGDLISKARQRAVDLANADRSGGDDLFNLAVSNLEKELNTLISDEANLTQVENQTPSASQLTRSQFEGDIGSTLGVYKPDGCSNCSVFIGSLLNLLEQAKNSSNIDEQFSALSKASDIITSHNIANQVAYASGQVLTDAEIFNLFGANRDEFIQAMRTALQSVTTALSETGDQSVVYTRLVSLQNDLSGLLMRFNPNEEDLVKDNPQWLAFRQFVYYVTGIWPTPGNEYLIAQRMEQDHYVIKQKYGLPPRDLRADNLVEYIRQLEKIAQQNNIPIRSSTEYQAFFSKFSSVGGVYDDALRSIFVPLVDRNNTQMLTKYAGSLEHELIHGLQDKQYPGMPIEAMEYEAYVGANMSLGYLMSNPIDAIDTIFSFYVRGSVNHWYYEKQEIKPWINIQPPATVTQSSTDQPQNLLEAAAKKVTDPVTDAGDREIDKCNGGQGLRLMPQVYAAGGGTGCSLAGRTLIAAGGKNATFWVRKNGWKSPTRYFWQQLRALAIPQKQTIIASNTLVLLAKYFANSEAVAWNSTMKRFYTTKDGQYIPSYIDMNLYKLNSQGQWFSRSGNPVPDTTIIQAELTGLLTNLAKKNDSKEAFFADVNDLFGVQFTVKPLDIYTFQPPAQWMIDTLRSDPHVVAVGFTDPTTDLRRALLTPDVSGLSMEDQETLGIYIGMFQSFLSAPKIVDTFANHTDREAWKRSVQDKIKASRSESDADGIFALISKSKLSRGAIGNVSMVIDSLVSRYPTMFDASFIQIVEDLNITLGAYDMTPPEEKERIEEGAEELVWEALEYIALYAKPAEQQKIVRTVASIADLKLDGSAIYFNKGHVFSLNKAAPQLIQEANEFILPKDTDVSALIPLIQIQTYLAVNQDKWGFVTNYIYEQLTQYSLGGENSEYWFNEYKQKPNTAVLQRAIKELEIDLGNIPLARSQLAAIKTLDVLTKPMPVDVAKKFPERIQYIETNTTPEHEVLMRTKLEELQKMQNNIQSMEYGRYYFRPSLFLTDSGSRG
jgi:hypothetical protein